MRRPELVVHADWSTAPTKRWCATASLERYGCYRCIETDVRATRDGSAVLFHDERLDRVTDETGPIAGRTWAELASIRVGGAEPIPRLEDLLAAWPDLRLIIDPKSDDAVPPLIEALCRNGVRKRVCIGSFSARRLRQLRTEAPGYTSCTRAEVLRLRAASYGMPMGSIVADCAQVPLRYSLPGALSIQVVDAAFVRTAMTAACRSRSGRSTTSRRWNDSSTSGLTAS